MTAPGGVSLPKNVVLRPLQNALAAVRSFRSRCFLLEKLLLDDRLAESGITGSAARQPDFEPFHVHHLAVLGIFVVHLEKHAGPVFLAVARKASEHAEVAVI